MLIIVCLEQFIRCFLEDGKVDGKVDGRVGLLSSPSEVACPGGFETTSSYISSVDEMCSETGPEMAGARPTPTGIPYHTCTLSNTYLQDQNIPDTSSSNLLSC